jgi:hypothetical protein
MLKKIFKINKIVLDTNVKIVNICQSIKGKLSVTVSKTFSEIF